MWPVPVALSLALLLLIWGYGGEDPFFAAAGFIVALSGCLLSAWQHGGIDAAGWLRLRSAKPIGILLLLGLVSLVPSINRHLSLLTILSMASLVFVFATVAALSEKESHLLLILSGSVVTLASLYGFGQLAGYLPSGFWHTSHCASRYVNSSHFASLVAMVLPLCVGLAFASRRSWVVLLYVLLVAVNGLAVMVAQSRWILVTIVPVMAVLLWRLCRKLPRNRWWVGSAVVFAVVAAGLALAFTPVGEMVMQRFRDLSVSQWQSLGQRGIVWRDTLNMIVHTPFGVGTGCFGDAYLGYKLSPDRFIAMRPHNEVLQWVAEVGWLALPALAWLVWAVMRDSVALRNRSAAPLRALPLAALACCLLMPLLHSMVDFPLRLHANAMLFTLLLGCIVNRNVASPSPESKTAAPVPLGRLVCVLLIGAWGVSGAAAFQLRQADRLAAQWDLVGEDQALRRSHALAPLNPHTDYRLASLLLRRSRIVPPAKGDRLQQDALQRAARAVRHGRARAWQHALHARILQATGAVGEAEASLLLAIQSDPTLGRYHFDYADFLLTHESPADAARRYRKGLDLFNDAPDLTLTQALQSLWEYTHDVRILALACPPGPKYQAIFDRFIRKHGSDGLEATH